MRRFWRPMSIAALSLAIIGVVFVADGASTRPPGAEQPVVAFGVPSPTPAEAVGPPIAVAAVLEALAGSLPDCAVTKPKGVPPPAAIGRPVYLGLGGFWTSLHPVGTIVGGRGFLKIDGDGSIWDKWPWWWAAIGERLRVEGHRLDAEAPPLRVEGGDTGGNQGFQMTVLTFPTEGCWQVTATAGSSSLTFVTRVIHIPASARACEPLRDGVRLCDLLRVN
jgi:hypothetical protein